MLGQELTDAIHSQNTDVYLGFIGWSAGAFDPRTYELSEVPSKSGGAWSDTTLVKACMAHKG